MAKILEKLERLHILVFGYKEVQDVIVGEGEDVRVIGIGNGVC